MTKQLLNSKYVPVNCYTGKSVEAKGINGQVHVPLAKVHIECERHVGNVEVLVIDEMDHDVLLGTELDSWDDLSTPVDTNRPTPNILVLTRAQKERQIDKEILAQDNMRNYAMNRPNSESDNIELDNEVVNHVHDNSANLDPDVQALLQGDVQKLIEMQNKDDTLENIRASLTQGNDKWYSTAMA